MLDLRKLVLKPVKMNPHTQGVCPSSPSMYVRFHYNELNFSRIIILSDNYWLPRPVGPFSKLLIHAAH